MILSLFTFFVLFSTTAFASEPITFGPEFNFTNYEMWNAPGDGLTVNNPESVKVQTQFMKSVLAKCKTAGCRVENYYNRYGVLSYKVIFNDSWYFRIETDPGVVEIQTKPTSLADNVKLYSRYKKMIFETASELGLQRPNSYRNFDGWAGGHIHIGIKEAFGENLMLFRNFIVDYTNHIVLAHRFFANDVDFAPSIAILSEQQKLAFKSLIKDVDGGKVKSINEFAIRLQKEVYHKNPKGHEAEKHQALNVTRIVDNSTPLEGKTLEMRAFRAQGSPEVYFLQQRAIEKRIYYLKTKGPIPVNFHNINSLSAYDRTKMFYEYITESGLPFKDYEMWLTDVSEKKAYEEKFKNQQSSCLNVLSGYLK